MIIKELKNNTYLYEEKLKDGRMAVYIEKYDYPLEKLPLDFRKIREKEAKIALSKVIKNK